MVSLLPLFFFFIYLFEAKKKLVLQEELFKVTPHWFLLALLLFFSRLRLDQNQSVNHWGGKNPPRIQSRVNCLINNMFILWTQTTNALNFWTSLSLGIIFYRQTAVHHFKKHTFGELLQFALCESKIRRFISLSCLRMNGTVQHFRKYPH